MASFYGLNLVCADVDATADFYRLLGVEVPEIWRTASGAHHVGEMVVSRGADIDIDLDSTAMAEAYNAGYRDRPTPGGVVIGFRLPTRDAVDDLYASLTAAGYEGRQPPCDPFWGARYAIVADPDGRDVGLMSPSDPARRAAPPDL